VEEERVRLRGEVERCGWDCFQNFVPIFASKILCITAGALAPSSAR
jgi:hypothetical protein